MVNLTGSTSADVLSGSNDADDLAGGAGADTLTGGGGGDVLYSGERSPQFTSPYYNNPFTTPVLDTGAEIDRLNGGAGSDRLFAGYGDFVEGGTSNDVYGADADALFISFMGASSGVTADFRQLDNGGTLTIGGGSLTGIETLGWVEGSNFADVLTANAGSGLNFAPIFGMGGNDQIILGYYSGVAYGGDGNDTIDAKAAGYGNPIYGEAGNDFIIGGGGYETIDGGDGDDNIQGNYGFDTITGGSGNDTIDGGSFSDTIRGGTGDDLIYGAGDFDILDGGDGNDTLYAQYSPLSADGATSSYQTGDTVFGGNGVDTIYGGSGNDILSSAEWGELNFYSTTLPEDLGSERDILSGADGNDILAFGYGDSVDGGAGDDTLRMSLAGYVGADGRGITFDTAGIAGAASFSFGGGTISNVETLESVRGTERSDTINAATQATLLLVDGGGGDDTITGNGSSVRMLGGTGNDLLISGNAVDLMDGGSGDDVLVVNSSADNIMERVGEGRDTVLATGSYTLSVEAEIETLSAATNASTSTAVLIGNQYAQTIVGDYGNNSLTGGGTVLAGGGNDVLIGLRGDDAYVIDSVRSVIIENGGEGNDTATVTLSGNNFVLNEGSAVETLQAAAGTDAINITGNPGAQTLIGNDGANILSGAGGGDTLVGLGGDDVFQVRSLGDQVIEANGGGRDTVFATVSYNLGVNEVEVLSTVVNAATDAIDLIGNFASQLVIGNYGNNVLNGGSGGIDTLIGLRGDDLYAVGDGRTVIGDGVGEGTDTVVASVSYTLSGGAEIEVLAAQNRGGTEAFTLRGNEFAQTVAGNEGANTIDGGGNMDTLVGGGGADVFAFTSGLSALNVDMIRDFGGGDRIGLSSGVFAAATDGGIGAGEFVIGTAAQDADDRLVYDQASGRLFYDADGNGATAGVLFAQLAAGTVLAATDFVVVAPVTP